MIEPYPYIIRLILLFVFHCMYFSSTGRKVDDPELLEAIRLTIINNLLEFHPVLTLKIFYKPPSSAVLFA